MSRDESVEYEQDNQGNERKKLDTLRAQEGMDAANDEGLQFVGTADTGSDLLLYSSPTHVHEFYVDEIHAFNSAATGGEFSLFEAQLDSNGSITSTTRRSVPINVGSSVDTQVSYSGDAFPNHLAVNSNFAGYVGVGVIVDNREYDEPASEQTGT